MLFKSLEPFVGAAQFHMILDSKGPTMTLTVVPKSKADGKKDLNTTPFTVTGTAEELDAQLPAEIKKAFGEAIGFMANTEDFIKGAKEKAAGTAKTSNTSTAGSGKKNETPAAGFDPKKLGKSDKAIYDLILKNVDDAKKRTDIDMVEFLKNSCIKETQKATADVKDELLSIINKEFDAIAAGLANKADVGSTETGDNTLFSGQQAAGTGEAVEEKPKEKGKGGRKKKEETPPTPPPADEATDEETDEEQDDDNDDDTVNAEDDSDPGDDSEEDVTGDVW